MMGQAMRIGIQDHLHYFLTRLADHHTKMSSMHYFGLDLQVKPYFLSFELNAVELQVLKLWESAPYIFLVTLPALVLVVVLENWVPAVFVELAAQ